MVVEPPARRLAARDRALTRSSQVTHYFFEGTRYWKPLASDASERAYWDPTWIH